MENRAHTEISDGNQEHNERNVYMMNARILWRWRALDTGHSVSRPSLETIP